MMNTKKEQMRDKVISVQDATAYFIDVLDDYNNPPEDRCYVDDAYQDSIAQMRAALSNEQAALNSLEGKSVPEGWKLVPIEPTKAMEFEGAKERFISDKRTNGIYKAMLAAAPQPPLVEDRVRELDDDDKTVATSDRGMLNYLMQAFEGEAWECERCGHSEDCKTMDSAKFLKDYLDRFPEPPQEGKSAPAGWKLVPVNPTYQMGSAAVRMGCKSTFSAERFYEAMLGAAPSPQETIAVSVDMNLCHYEHIVVDDSEESDAGVWPVLVPNGFKIVPAIAEDRVREFVEQMKGIIYSIDWYCKNSASKGPGVPEELKYLIYDANKAIAAMKEPNTSEDSNKLKGEG